MVIKTVYIRNIKGAAYLIDNEISDYKKYGITIFKKDGEVIQSLHDLREVGCDVVTFGQYLAPTARHKKFLPIVEYVHPDKFAMFKEEADKLGFMYVASGPLVRSSYKAGEYFMKGVIENDRDVQTSLKTYPVQ